MAPVLALMLLFSMGSCSENKKASSKPGEYTEKGADFFNQSLPEEDATSDKNMERDDASMGRPEIVPPLQNTREYVTHDTQEKDLFLAATKLCWNYDYQTVFGDFRKNNRKNGKERITIDNCCAALVPQPYISPLEYYYNLYHRDNAIVTYQNNVFKLREIRKALIEEKQESFKNLVMKSTPEEMVSYTMTRASIQEYDFSTGQMHISYTLSANPRIGRSVTQLRVKGLGKRYRSSFSYDIAMTEEQAKKVYEHYASLEAYSGRKNPPFPLVTKTTYALDIPEVEYRPYVFEVKIKTIAFYRQSDGYPSESDKLGELQFVEGL